MNHSSARDSWTLTNKSGLISVGVTAPFSWVLAHTRLCLCPSRVYFPVLCKFWQFSGGVNGDLLQEDLYQTQVYCTQSPNPCSIPLLSHTSAGDTQIQFCLNFCGCSGSWCTQGLFEPSESLWWVWSLILNAILPVLPSCWGFFALGRGVSFFGGIQHSTVDGHSAEVVILEFFQEKLNACPSTLPSWRKCWERRRLYMCGHREYMGDIHTFLTILLWIKVL